MHDVRVRRNLTQTELAIRLGASKNQVGRYEQGEADPSIEVLVRLVTELGVSSDWLIGVSDAQDGPKDGLSATETQLIQALRSKNAADVMRIATQIIDS